MKPLYCTSMSRLLHSEVIVLHFNEQVTLLHSEAIVLHFNELATFAYYMHVPPQPQDQIKAAFTRLRFCCECV